MMTKLSFVAGFAAGYLAGSRAGRQRYEEIVATARAAWESDTAQAARDRVAAEAAHLAPVAAETVVDAVGRTTDAVRGMASRDDHSAAPAEEWTP